MAILWKSREKEFAGEPKEMLRQESIREKLWARGVPPLPSLPWKGLPGAGFAKSVCKILSGNGLNIKILERKHLHACFRLLAPFFGVIIFCLFCF